MNTMKDWWVDGHYIAAVNEQEARQEAAALYEFEPETVRPWTIEDQEAYIVQDNPAKHTCWDNPEWDGTMEVDCAGCDQAAEYPCIYCGYGHVFTTHNNLAHYENGDMLAPDDDDDSPLWFESPHIYGEN